MSLRRRILGSRLRGLGQLCRDRGAPAWTSAPTWWATSRTIRSPSAADSRSPVSASPLDSRSIQSLPSGFSITSTMPGSSRKAAIAGPSAVRSRRAARDRLGPKGMNGHPRPRLEPIERGDRRRGRKGRNWGSSTSVWASQGRGVERQGGGDVLAYGSHATSPVVAPASVQNVSRCSDRAPNALCIEFLVPDYAAAIKHAEHSWEGARTRSQRDRERFRLQSGFDGRP
jgi:hypothetical protein